MPNPLDEHAASRRPESLAACCAPWPESEILDHLRPTLPQAHEMPATAPGLHSLKSVLIEISHGNQAPLPQRRDQGRTGTRNTERRRRLAPESPLYGRVLERCEMAGSSAQTAPQPPGSGLAESSRFSRHAAGQKSGLFWPPPPRQTPLPRATAFPATRAPEHA